MRTDVINGRELKVGSVFIPAEDPNSFYKVADVTTAKPGKHGSAKSIVTAKNIKNGKSYLNTFLDCSERVTLIQDFGYKFDVVYEKVGSEIIVDLEENRSIYIQSFIPDDREIVEEEFKKLMVNGKLELLNSEGSQLCIKYSEHNNDTLVFWELLYIKPADFQRHGILKYSF